MEEFDEDEKVQGFFVICNEVVKDKELLAVTRLLASDLMVKNYLSVGDFLKNITDTDLKTLIDGSVIDDDNHELLDDIMLIALMLSNAESSEEVKSLDDFQRIISQFISFLAMESLYRKGLIKLYRENMSFSKDMGDKMVAERIV
jgi:hypothetical protein